MIRFAKLHPQATIPTRATPGSAGLDLCAVVESPPDLYPGASWAETIEPRQRRLVRTGLQVIIPPGYEGQVRPRSGLALKHGVTVILGTIDSDYRGELHVLLVNLGREPFVFRHGDRVAQLAIAPVAMLELLEVEPQPTDTKRGAGGFGSTGVRGG